MEFEKHWMFSLKPKATAKNIETENQYDNTLIAMKLYITEKKKAPNKLQMSNISFSLYSICQQLIKYYNLKIKDPM